MIYLDFNATTPLEDSVVEAMWPYLKEHHGNPSSGHALGRKMRSAIDRAREQVARLLGASPDEIVFTSGGSESNNFVLKGMFERYAGRPCHIVTSAVEHPAILAPCAFLESRGCKITKVPVDGTGWVDPEDVRKAITPDTILVTIMHANNEVGTIQPLADIARIAHEAGVPVHTDAAQSIGKIDAKVDDLGVDFLTLAGHKLYAPAGVGALYIRSGQEIEPLIHGAGHEKGRRSGTEPVPSIVGLGVAAELAADTNSGKSRGLCAKFHNLLREGLGDRVVLNGHPENRLPNTLNIGFRELIGQDILAKLPEIAASPGAACHGGRHDPSQVLSAMNVPRDIALGAIRFSLGRHTTESEIDTAAAMVVAAVRSIG